MSKRKLSDKELLTFIRRKMIEKLSDEEFYRCYEEEINFLYSVFNNPSNKHGEVSLSRVINSYRNALLFEDEADRILDELQNAEK